MKQISIFNHVIGPVMHGPSSSHTAGAFHIGAIARSLLGERPAKAVFSFDVDGSYSKTYHEQGADLAFATGLMGWEITDDRFYKALDLAAGSGLDINFRIQKLEKPEHPNTVDIQLFSADGRKLDARANSIGGGTVEFTRVNGWSVNLTGYACEVLVESEGSSEDSILELLTGDDESLGEPLLQERDDLSFLHVRRRAPLQDQARQSLEAIPGCRNVWIAEPVFFVQNAEPIFHAAKEMVHLADQSGSSLGRIALEYESVLLGLTNQQVLDEMMRRLDIMRQSVERGLSDPPGMRLLAPSANSIYTADAEGRLAIGGLHTRAAARAMAVMHVNGGMGVVCAAPTGGAAGTLPGVIVTLSEEKGISREDAALALLAAGAVGVIVANRATFAAEVAGCQVEIGAAGAMAAAAVVDAFGGSAQQAADAAAIAFQNTMGSVCDLVQGMVEIPCHTRNAAAASNAFLCADLIMGGYINPINLDETIDAVYSVGKMLPGELRCTALGGLAVTPFALKMEPRNLTMLN
jgi:L-serine dehydratase